MNKQSYDNKSLLLTFTLHYFQKRSINTHTGTLSNFNLSLYDRQLRTTLMKNNSETEYKKTYPALPDDLLKNPRILFLRDIFEIEYILIPCFSSNDHSIIIVGPFLMEAKSNSRIRHIARKLAIPANLFNYTEQYYAALPYITDIDALFAFTDTLSEQLFGKCGTDSLRSNELDFSSVQLTNESTPNITLAPQFMQRYLNEEKGLTAVTVGDYQTAEKYLLPGAHIQIELRQSNPIRNYKNYIISLNTLLRKAAQKGHVHPVYIDDLSRQLSMKVETLSSLRELSACPREMIRKYCLLVQRFSNQNYSLVVKKIIHLIHLEPESNLSLDAIASRLELSRTYISSLFKKETGITLTEYVNKSKMDYAAALLDYGYTSIKEVSLACGISDQSYFSKLFKRYQGVAPKEYRQKILQK